MKTDLLWAAGLFAAVLGTAAVVNAVAPAQRSRIRRVVFLFVAYLGALALHHVLAATGATRWSDGVKVASELLQAFTIVNIVATAGFAVALPRVGVAVPMIASDLAVGFGYLLVTFGVLSNHHVEATGILATSAVVSAVLAISLQSTLGNILGGVALQLDGSIHEGDWIQLENGKQGRVRQVRWRHTVVETRDWSTIIVPNMVLLGGNIMILGKRDGRDVPQRMWIWFNVDFRYPPTRVIDVVSEAVCRSPIKGVAADPRPNVVCMDFAKEMSDSFATYAVRYWLTDLANDDPTSSLVRARVYTALRRASIPFALPAQTALVELQDAAVRERHARDKIEARLTALRSIDLFRHLTATELEKLAAGMSHGIYTAGEVITHQGAVAHWLYVLVSGKVQIRASVDPDGGGPRPARETNIATLEAPNFFGEMGLMTGEPRTADVIALSDVDCFRLGKATFEQVLVERPEIADVLSETLAARRVNFIERCDGFDAGSHDRRQATERDRILDGIKGFFGL